MQLLTMTNEFLHPCIFKRKTGQIIFDCIHLFNRLLIMLCNSTNKNTYKRKTDPLSTVFGHKVCTHTIHLSTIIRHNEKRETAKKIEEVILNGMEQNRIEENRTEIRTVLRQQTKSHKLHFCNSSTGMN